MMIVDTDNRERCAPLMRAMFAARKQVFVDLLKWDLPVLGERYEVDQFDGTGAVYLILADRDGAHLGSARLLPTTRPHILDTLFPMLCEANPPSGDDIFEITRFCLDRRLDAARRREVRNALVCALVDHALTRGIRTYTGVAEIGWLQQILAFGWRCRALGMPQRIGTATLGALRIDIGGDTPALLQRAGIAAPLTGLPVREAA